ncbi:MAG: hypothetical protein AAF434_10320 [Pseudomonadota bacterium]
MNYQDTGAFFAPEVIPPSFRVADMLGQAGKLFMKCAKPSGKRGSCAMDSRTLHDIGMTTLQFKYGVSKPNIFE